MITGLNRFRAILKKEWLLEWRGKELLTLLLCNAILMSALVGAGVSSAMMEPSKVARLFPSLLWMVFLLAAVSAMTRSNEHELEGHAFEGLLLAGAGGVAMYCAKVVVTSLFFLVSFTATLIMMAVALDQAITSVFVDLLMCGGLVSLGLASLVVLLSIVASTSRLKGVLLPIISLPLLFPIFFGGVEITFSLLLTGGWAQAETWVGILGGCDLVFFVVGVNVYEGLLRD